MGRRPLETKTYPRRQLPVVLVCRSERTEIAVMLGPRKVPLVPRLCGRSLLAFVGCWAAALGCGGNDSTEPSTRNLSFLQITPDQRVARAGDVFSLGLVARDANGDTVRSASAQWTTANPAVATVDPTGKVSALRPGTVAIIARSGGQQATATVVVGAATYNYPTLQVPQFIQAHHHQLGNIYAISRFRSAIGHSSTDGTETCRSMRHYFVPWATLEWSTLPIYAPVTGTVSEMRQDGLWGQQIFIIPRDFTAARIGLYHAAPDPFVAPGTWLEAGQRIGTHSSKATYSDIGVFISTPVGERWVSLFSVLPDALFTNYMARGVPSREAAIITKAERDADPVPCIGDQGFAFKGNIENWVYLR